MTLILGVETSCDETACAVVENGNLILSDIVRSQTVHNEFGGVVPDLSSREHTKFIDAICNEALRKAGITINDIDAVAAVNGPGLVGSLMIGLMFAKGIALRNSIPLITVNHVRAHIYANFLKKKQPDFPFIALVVSGGHSSLFRVESWNSMNRMGSTLDDAAGEAFDKCAKMLGLPYPGGPAVEKISADGKPAFHRFPRSKTGSLDFSFSGLKTSVLYYIRDMGENFVKQHIADIAASLQEAIVDQLIDRSEEAMKQTGMRRLLLAGGVSANSRLREKAEAMCADMDAEIYIPEIKYCTDNAAVTAGLAYRKFTESKLSDMNVNVYSRSSEA